MRRRSRESLALIALAVEARQRGVTYGRLVAATTEDERQRIVERYLKRPRSLRKK